MSTRVSSTDLTALYLCPVAAKTSVASRLRDRNPVPDPDGHDGERNAAVRLPVPRRGSHHVPLPHAV